MARSEVQSVTTGWFAGIDLSSTRIHLVGLDDGRRIIRAEVLSPTEPDRLIQCVEGAASIAIDAPDRFSAGPHRHDDSLAPKFRTARCGEIALGRDFGIWVPWTTPMTNPLPSWMAVGFAIYELLRAHGHEPVETYPHAAFRRLGGGTIPSKQTISGIRQRASLLRSAGLEAGFLEMWSHDGVDAAVAAIVAHDRFGGRATAATCGHDGSAIWLPAARAS
jgi:predicted nuclease with RNAse H fold